jgi:hypothetical protein
MHMALEDFLLTGLEQGTDIRPYAARLLTGSKSISVTAVLCSVLMKYPFALGYEVLSFLKVKEFYELDFNRKTEDMFQSSMAVYPDEPYLAAERTKSNAQPYRQGDLEQLAFGLQLYGVAEVDGIIDDLKKLPGTKNSNWGFRFQRMDKRERDITHTETAMVITPKPLPKKLQKIAESSQSDVNERQLSAAYMWAVNQFKEEAPSTLEEWRKHYASCLLEASGTISRIMRPQLLVAALGIRDHLNQLTAEEFNFAAGQLTAELQKVTSGFRTGHFDVMALLERAVLRVMPLVLQDRFYAIKTEATLKRQLTELFLFLDDHYIHDLVAGIGKYGWQLDPAFCETLAASSISLHRGPSPHRELTRLLREADPVPEAKFANLVDALTVNELSFNPPFVFEQDSDYQRVVQGLLMVPFAQLNEGFYEVIKGMLAYFSASLRPDYRVRPQKKNFGVYLGDLLSSDSSFAVHLLERVLENIPDDAEYFFKIINDMTLSGHDKHYPLAFWQKMTRLARFFLTTSMYNGLAFALFFGEMPAPLDIRYKVPLDGTVAVMYEALVKSGLFDDSVIGPKLFRFLSGIGTVYQPQSLEWLLEGSVKYNNGFSYYSHEDLERYISQLYTDHIGYILSRPDLKAYYLKFLDFLIDRESVLAFRIREEIF